MDRCECRADRVPCVTGAGSVVGSHDIDSLHEHGAIVHALLAGHDAVSEKTGWRPRVDLADAIERTIEWDATHHNHWKEGADWR